MFRFTHLTAAAAALAVLATAGLAASQPAQPPGRGGQAAAPAAPQPTGKAPAVSVTGGRTAGLLFNDVAVYRGIPYAAAPVGALRWRSPQPVRAWSGTKDGAANGAACTAAEDCLYVNVYKPADARAGARLPVMVWIHGGAFTGGSGNIYDGSQFARMGTVVVTVNYRLGRAGWYSHPALTRTTPAGEAHSNYGQQDAIAALKWVKANINTFGGAPNNVTIFGESAGAIMVNYLMVSPPAQGLFHKAISQSGFGRLEPRPLATAEQTGSEFFGTLGVTGNDAAAAARLRALTFDQLRGATPLGSIGPIMDGKTIVVSTADGFAAGRQSKIPYMLGGNSNEASLFPTANAAGRLAALPNRPALNAAYGTGEAGRVINAIVTDQQITEGDRHLARAHTRLGQPTFAYYFSYVPPAQRATSLGMAHGGEIGYVFGRAFDDPQDFSIAQRANAYWAAFAKYGDPGAAAGPRWPKYDLQREARIEFGSDGVKVIDQFHKARLDWTEQNRVQVIASAAAGAAPAAAAPAAAPAGRGGGAPPGRGGGGRGGAGGGRGGAGGN